MSQTDNSNALTWVLGGALLLIGLFVVVLLVSVNSQADSVSTSTSVANSSPTLTIAVADDGATVTPTSGSIDADNPGTYDTITFTGTITDANGTGSSFASGDLASLSARLYRTNATGGVACTADKNDCYVSSDCALVTFPTTTTATYQCTVDLYFWADSTSSGGAYPTGDSWTAYAKVVDDSSADGTVSQTHPNSTTLALSIPTSINYGALSREASTTNSNNQEMTITQWGNDVADVLVSATDLGSPVGTGMDCTVVGEIPISNQKWSLTDLSAGATGVTAMTSSAVDTNLAVGYRTDDATATTKVLYWNLIMPAVVSGTCTGTTTISGTSA